VFLSGVRENDPLSPGYILTDGDRRVISALAEMWQRGGQGSHYAEIELKMEGEKPLGMRDFREIAINSMALKELSEIKE